MNISATLEKTKNETASELIGLQKIETLTTVLFGLIVIITTPICILTVRELVRMPKIHKNFRFIQINLIVAYLFSIVLSIFQIFYHYHKIKKRYIKIVGKIHWTCLYTISLSVTFLVVERIVALIFVKTYEHFNNEIPILGICLSLISWLFSACIQILYVYKIVNDFHMICFTGFLQITIIFSYVAYYFSKKVKLKNDLNHSLTVRYQQEENIKSASLLKYILSFTIIAVTYNIGFYIIFINYNFAKYGNGFSLLTFQIPQLIQVMTNVCTILKQQKLKKCVSRVISKYIRRNNKTIPIEKKIDFKNSVLRPIDLIPNTEKTKHHFESLQEKWKCNK